MKNSSNANCSFDLWATRDPEQANLFRIFAIIATLTVLVVIVVLGNALVIAAVLTRRRLRTATGLLILSLALADLLVGLVILPFSIANEVFSGFWIFGDVWCTTWLTMDIWMCTASIYNLVAISLDRYIAILMPLNYPMLVTKFRAKCIVAIVWLGSFLICSPSFMLASTEKSLGDCSCTPANAGTIYIISSAALSFYVPMLIVIFVYVRIYVAARAATKSLYSGMMNVTGAANRNPKSYLMQNPGALSKGEQVPMLRVHRGSTVTATSCSKRESIVRNAKRHSQITPPFMHDAQSTNSMRRFSDQQLNKRNIVRKQLLSTLSNDLSLEGDSQAVKAIVEDKTVLMQRIEENHRDSVASENSISSSFQAMESSTREGRLRPMTRIIGRLMKRGTRKKRSGGVYEKRLSLEIKAAKTVAIVTGCFIFCWLGFSILYGFSIETDHTIWSILFWLGYLNSALNPVIYTVFNREFRACFRRFLTCDHLNFAQKQPTVQQTTFNSHNSAARATTSKMAISSSSAPAHFPPVTTATMKIANNGLCSPAPP